MQYTRESALERLLKNYEPYYDIHMMINGDQSPITARCDFFEHSGQYVISKKAELWSADNEEFLYLVNVPHLTLDLFESLKNEIHEDGMGRIHVGPGHMASYITAVFICDTCDEVFTFGTYLCGKLQCFLILLTFGRRNADRYQDPSARQGCSFLEK